MNPIEALREVISLDRRALHKIPEPGFKEYKTGQYIKDKLDELGVNYELVAKTGIVAFFEGVAPTKTVAFRTDMDGLSVTEQSNYAEPSTHENYMHACGHDGHMAMMLGLARYLSRPEVKLVDNILLIFQPAEEGPGGAEVIVKEGILEKYKVDEIYGIHVFPAIEQGKIGVCPGPMMAMTGEFDLEVISQSAHGAMPHTGIDAVVIASEMVMGLQTVVSRNIDPINPAVLTIGRISAGERRNVIAGNAVLEGTLRAFDKEVYNKIKQRVIQYASGIEKAYEVEVRVVFRDMYPPVVNDANLFNTFMNIHMEDTIVINPQMISEDFSYYQEKIPGLFYFIGSYNEAKGHVYPLHNSRFNFDDEIMVHGLRTYINILEHKGCILE